MSGLKQPQRCCRRSARRPACWPRRSHGAEQAGEAGLYRRQWPVALDAMVEEVAPAFEKATGIKIDFTLLPVDPWRARLKAELGAGSSGIDIAQWSVGMAGWMAPHMVDHEALLAQIKAQRPGVRLGRLPRRHQAGGHL